MILINGRAGGANSNEFSSPPERKRKCILNCGRKAVQFHAKDYAGGFNNSLGQLNSLGFIIRRDGLQSS